MARRGEKCPRCLARVSIEDGKLARHRNPTSGRLCPMSRQQVPRFPQHPTLRSSGTCPATGKERFADRWIAAVALEYARQSKGLGNGRRQEARIYQCEPCGGWHLTSWAAPPRRPRGSARSL